MITLTKEISENQFEWRNNPLIHAWTRQNGLINTADQMKWLEKIENDPTIQMFGILNENDINVGSCGLTDIRPIHGTCEFSLLIGPEHQRNGYGRQALIELFKYGFNHLRLNLIFGETLVGNPALDLFLKLGMTLEGHLRERYFKNGNYIDSRIVSITAKEAKAQSWY